MGFLKARELRKRQEFAAKAIERRIARRKREIAELEKLAWRLAHSDDWGAEEERKL